MVPSPDDGTGNNARNGVSMILGAGWAVGYAQVSGGFAGDGGPALSAGLSRPQGVTVDQAGDLLVADVGSNRIREVTG